MKPINALALAIGGAGLFGVSGHEDRPKNGVTLGVSAGAGISVPIGAGVRAFAEARSHFLLKTSAEPPWIVPVTFGVRF